MAPLRARQTHRGSGFSPPISAGCAECTKSVIWATCLLRSHHGSAPRRSGCVRPGRAFAPHRLRTCACRCRHPRLLVVARCGWGWRPACSTGLDAMGSPQRSQAPVRQSFPRYVRVNTLLASLRDVLIHLQVRSIAAVHCTRSPFHAQCTLRPSCCRRTPKGHTHRRTILRVRVVQWCVHVACRPGNLTCQIRRAKLPRTGGAD